MEMWAFKLLNYYIIVSIIISNIITFGSTNPEYVLHLGFRIIYSLWACYMECKLTTFLLVSIHKFPSYNQMKSKSHSGVKYAWLHNYIKSQFLIINK